MRRQSGMFISPSAGHFSTGGEYTKKKGDTMEFKRGDRVRTAYHGDGEYIAPWRGVTGYHGVLLSDGTVTAQYSDGLSRFLTDEEIAEQVRDKHLADSSFGETRYRAAILEAFRLRDERDGK